MAKIESIHKMIAPELEALNRIIRESLSNSSPLLQHIIDNYLKSKGKQIRPMLVLLSGKFFGEITDSVLQAGAAIEILHNASLIHDDVIDESKERRGVATINRIWDNHMAVLVGDFFTSSALHCAVQTNNPKVINTLSNLGRDLALGEIWQIDNARHHSFSEQEYFSTIRNKTASLFRCCVEVGGFASNAPDDTLADLSKYAEKLGLCFQIKDDIFDYFNDSTVGKPTGNDLREGKVTLPLIYALSRTDLPEHDAMNELVKKTELSSDEIDTLINFAKDNGGIDYAYAKMQEIQEEANKLLDKYPENESTKAFKAIFNYIIERNK